MTYLRIRKFWDYQNADAWKKSSQNKRGVKHPQWCKLYVYRDTGLDQYPCHIRLVWFELLRLATVHANAIPNETQAIAKQISMPHKQVCEAIQKLLEGAWIQETKTTRRSRNLSRGNLETKPPKKYRTEESTSVLQNAASQPTITNGHYGLEGAILNLVRKLPDRDTNTENVVRSIVLTHRINESNVYEALEAAMSPTAKSPTKVAISQLKKAPLR